MVGTEFQAVVLAAGKGSRMPEITSGKPKCLLPVGTKPLVWYPLLKLQQTGFTEVILIVLDTQKSEIQAALDSLNLDLKIDYVTISGNEDLGTADSLILIQDRLESDVLLISCDFISDCSLKGVIDLFRMHDATLSVLLFNQQLSDSVSASMVPGPKSKHKTERDLIGIDRQTGRLVFLASATDFERELSLPRSLLRKHTQIDMYSKMLDSHVYVLKRWVVKFLYNQQSFSTVKGELLPYIIKKQLSRPNDDSVRDISNIFYHAKEDDFKLLIRETSSFCDHIGDTRGIYHGDAIRCYAHVASSSNFGIRINTLPAYCSINNKIGEKWDKITRKGMDLVKKHPTADVKSSQVDDKCIVWENAKLHEKTSFKNSIIGSGTEVKSFSRVFNSIIMNNVTIKEKVALENCIVADGAVIESGCQIKNCLIGTHHTVPENSDHDHEVLTQSDRLMEF